MCCLDTAENVEAGSVFSQSFNLYKIYDEESILNEITDVKEDESKNMKEGVVFATEW